MTDSPAFRPFCIIGTPRSRTAWFAMFLSHGAVACEHEPSVQFTSDDDMRQWFAWPNRGACDSMLTLKWRELQAAGVRLFAIVRSRQEVLESAMKAGIASAGAVRVLDRIYSEIRAQWEEVPRYAYSDLSPRTCSDIFCRIHGEAPPAAWLHHWCNTNVQADYSAVAAQAARNGPGLAAFYGPLLRESA